MTRPLRVCLEPGCPEITTTPRCAQHTRAKEQARGSSTARGYGSRHQRIRAEWQRRMDAGETVICWRCETKGQPHPIDPTSWDLGHEGGEHRGPECVAGNRAEPRLRGR